MLQAAHRDGLLDYDSYSVARDVWNTHSKWHEQLCTREQHSGQLQGQMGS